ncbi:unnamed protein product [Ilex paraguariensis]|uniref:Oxidation resistance protein 1 n=1 Tax=Ilex paraguariensis TaxID=185542 RepID=A0ABC8U0I2_9AQUA
MGDISNSKDGEISMQTLNEPAPSETLPETSEPSLLLSEKTRGALYVALPALAQGKKWVLLYSTWRHGISLSTLYRRSMLCPGLTLLLSEDFTLCLMFESDLKLQDPSVTDGSMFKY